MNVLNCYLTCFATYIEITKNYAVNYAQYEDGEIDSIIYCKKFRIFINNDGLVQKVISPSNLGSSLRDRLKHRDITRVELFYDGNLDVSHEEICVPFSEVYGYNNEYQEHKWVDDGIYISIEGLQVR